MKSTNFLLATNAATFGGTIQMRPAALRKSATAGKPVTRDEMSALFAAELYGRRLH